MKPADGTPQSSTSFRDTYLKFGRVSTKPFQRREFYESLLLLKHASITLPAFSYTIVFAFASILMTVEIPQIFGVKFGFNAQQLGLQFIGIIVGYAVSLVVGT